MTHRLAITLALSALTVLTARSASFPATGVSARWEWPWCTNLDDPPADGFESAGMGLMRSEMRARY